MFLDFLIVVVGVFIGIQVANWNQDLADQRLGEDYRQRLIEDLQKDLARVRGRETYCNAGGWKPNAGAGDCSGSGR